MPPEACLDEREVEQLLLGALPSGDAEASERHLLGCDRCLSSAEQTNAADELVDALSSPTDASGLETDDAPLVASLIDKLSVAAADAASREQVLEELEQVLTAARAEDELGRLGHFRVLQLLGAGGMGVVLKAEDVQLGRIVALKILRPSLSADADAKRRFQREARLTAAFEHDHVVTIYQVEEQQGIPFFAMQWLEGESLRDRLRRAKKLSVAEALRIAREIAAGLSAAHARGLLHRDIKPDNVWLQTETDHVTIVDFGLVRSIEEPSSLTRSNTILGTPQYMAPEQACGERVDARCDLFSTGCVLYQMLTGRPAFKAGNVVATLVAVSKEEVAPPRQVDGSIPRPVSELTMKLLAKDPEERIATADQLTREIAAIENNLPALATRAARSPVRKKLAAWLLAASLAVAALAVVTVQTDKGTLAIEADDEVAVRVEGGAVLLHDGSTGRTYQLRVGENRLRSGQYEIIVKDSQSGLEFSSREFAIRRGDEQRVSVALRDVPPVAVSGVRTGAESPSIGATGPKWLDDVDQSLGVKPGEPLSALALVQQPARLEDAVTWTLETPQHRSAVTRAYFSPDGKRIATAGNDGTVRILRADSDPPALERVIVCPGVADTLAWSHSGEVLATAHHVPQDAICLWRLAAEGVELVGRISRRTSQLAWSPDDTQLAFTDGGVQLWNVATDEVLPNFGMTGRIHQRAWSADGRYLAALEEAAIKVWDVVSPKLYTTIDDNVATTPIFSREGAYVAYVNNELSDHRVHIWDVEKNQRVRRIELGLRVAGGIAWSPDGSRVAVRSDNETSLWDVKAGRRLPMANIDDGIVGPGYAAGIGNWSGDGGRLLQLIRGNAYCWNANTDSWRKVAGPSVETVTDVLGDHLAVRTFHSGDHDAKGNLSSQIDVWNINSLEHFNGVDGADVESFHLSPNGRMLAMVGPRQRQARRGGGGRQSQDGPLVLKVYDTVLGDLVNSSQHDASVAHGATWSPDASKLLLRNPPNTLSIVNVRSGEILHVLVGPNPSGRRDAPGEYRSMLAPSIWSPDGNMVAWRSDMVTITITDATSGQTERTLNCVKTQEVEDAQDLRILQALKSQGARDLSADQLIWSGDGRRIACLFDASRLGTAAKRLGLQSQISVQSSARWPTISIWDLDQSNGDPAFVLQPRLVPNPRSGGFGSIGPPQLLFSPDGSHLLLRHSNHLEYWDVESGESLTTAQIAELGASLFGGRVVGWFPRPARIVVGPLARGSNAPFGVYDMAGAGGMTHREAIGPLWGSADVRGDQLHLRSINFLQSFDSSLQLQTTRYFESRDGRCHILQIGTDGQVGTSDGATQPVAIVLTDRGQRTLTMTQFKDRYAAPSAGRASR